MPKDSLSIFYVPFPDEESASLMASNLLKEKLVGCCNLIKGMQSFYWWEGKIEQSSEVILIIKTLPSLASKTIGFIEAHHPYLVPCILQLESQFINASYLSWMEQSVASSEENTT